jgi:predicted PurR-regulated permease PerM
MAKEEYVLTKQYEADRDEKIKDEIYNSLHQSKDAHLEEFRNSLGEEAYARLEKDSQLEDRFEKYYTDLKAKPPPLTPPLYDYDLFVQLRAAMRNKDAFDKILLGDNLSPEDRAKRLQEQFRRKREMKFVSDLQDKEEYAFLQLDNVKKRLAEWVPEFTKWLTGIGVGIFQFMVQFALSLLLSFFITFDMPRLRRGVRRLETSRISDFYLEIAPGLINFGRLIGRAFQAQGVIALCNTILTLLILKLPAILGTGPAIQNEVFLCAIVFLCSFIPVLGVVFSSVPIAVMAIIQPEGSFLLAIYAIIGILAVHFIETSILNPKILGDMLHLHPVMVLGILAMGEYFFQVWGLLLGVPVAVYIIRYVILAEDMHLPPSLQTGVARIAGIRDPRSDLLGPDEPEPKNVAPDLPSKIPPEPVGAGKQS